MIYTKPTKRIAWRFRGLFFGLISIASLGNAYAAGTSDSTILGLSNLPCDGVTYPVAVSYHVYSTPAGTKQLLPVNIRTTLTVSNEKSTTNTVSTDWEINAQWTFGSEVSYPGLAKITQEFSFGFSVGQTYTNGSTSTFSNSNTASMVAKVDGVGATPSFFKLQGWGARFKCNPTEGIQRLDRLGALQFDIAYGQGWVLTTNEKPSNPATDYTP